MRVRLKIALPLIGLFIFGTATYHSTHSGNSTARRANIFGGRQFDWIPIRQTNAARTRRPAETSKRTAERGSFETDGFTRAWWNDS